MLFQSKPAMKSGKLKQSIPKKEKITIVATGKVAAAPDKKTYSPSSKRRKMLVVHEAQVDNILVETPKATTKLARKNLSPIPVSNNSDDSKKSSEYESVGEDTNLSQMRRLQLQ